MLKRAPGKPVIICTEYRGVFFGFAAGDTTGDTIDLEVCRMAIRWGTTEGVQQLASTGPTNDSMIGAACPAQLRKVTAVFSVSEEAVAKWLEV